jgi:hypothetical protein
MPRLAMKPAPASAPPMRAESCVVREIPMAATRCAWGTVALTRAVRRPMSDGFMRPTQKATASTLEGLSLPLTTSTRITPASSA